MHFNSANFYNGIINAIRDITSNPDQSVSNQEKVIASMLKVFPGATATSHGSGNIVSTIMYFPVNELPAAEKTEVENILKTDAGSVFDLTPFFSPVSTLKSSDTTTITPNGADNHDVQRKSDVQALAIQIATSISTSPDTKSFYTGADQNLPDSKNNDPEWPTYFYTFRYSGNTVTASALTIKEYSKAEGNCADPRLVRSRWTYCVQEVVQ